MKKIIVILVVLLVVIALLQAFIYFKGILADKLKSVIERRLEHALNMGVKIGKFHISSNSIVFRNVILSQKEDPSKPRISIGSLKINFSLLSVLKSGKLLPLIFVEDFAIYMKGGPAARDLLANGSFAVSLRIDKNISKFFTSFHSIKKLQILNIDILSPLGEIKNMTGDILPRDDFFVVPKLTFDYNGIPYALSVDFEKKGAGTRFFTLRLSSVEVNIDADILDMPEVLKIEKLDGSFMNSSFRYTGEIDKRKLPAILTLNGESIVNIPDIKFLSPRLGNFLTRLRAEGTIRSAANIKGAVLSGPARWEIDIKSESDRIKIYDFRIDNLFFQLNARDGHVETSLLKAYPYNGVLISRIGIDPASEGVPYDISMQLDNIDVNLLAQDTVLKNKNIYGKLRVRVDLNGYAANINSMEGKGNITIEEANLGAAPILTPLLGSLYGYMQKMIPELKKIDITSATADFEIGARRIYTNNLALSGDIISISAAGYMGFDGSLDFDVRNEILYTSGEGESDWQKNLMNFVASVGSFLGNARLTGTLQNPKWEFQYINGVTNLLKGSLDKLIKDIF